MTHDELEEYINKFPEKQREVILKHILDSRLLARAFSTPEGKLILSGAVDMIRNNLLEILDFCIDDPIKESVIPKVMSKANNINTAYKLMTEWAKIIIRGSEHEK